MLDAVRLSFGTLSMLPVGHPTTVDRRTWGQALAFAPLVGVVLGGIAWALTLGVQELSSAPLLAAVTGVAALALLTRGLHLDGLADVADGLGSRRPPEQAREVMRRSDIGPFGVIALVLVLLLQVAALAQLLAKSDTAAIAVALVGGAAISRAAITLTCRRSVHPATAEGLGATVSESLSTIAAAAVVTTTVTLVAGAAALADVDNAVRVAASASLAIGIAEAWRRHCTRRFGGISGDVLGSVEQVAFTAFLGSLALVLP